jgi:hypothetical protein
MRRLIPLLALAAALLTAETASAAPFVPQAASPLHHPDCLAATGAPGELVHALSEDTQGMELLHAGPDGISPGQRLTFGDPAHPSNTVVIPDDCVSVSARPDGSALAAAAVRAADGSQRIAVASRAAGGSFGAPATVTDPIASDELSLVTAVLDDAGDALVAWDEGDDRRSRIRAMLRPAGGAFGAPVVLSAPGERPFTLEAGLGAGGEPIVAWSDYRTATRLGVEDPVRASIGFGPAQTIGTVPAAGNPALAVAPDGRALIVLPRRDAIAVSERPPGGAFGAPVVVAKAPDPLTSLVAAAIEPGGAAAVLWSGWTLGATGMVTRAGAGAFGAPVTLQRAAAKRVPPAALFPYYEPVYDRFGLAVTQYFSLGTSLTISAGDAVATWLGRAKASLGAVAAATVPLAGGPVERSRLVGPLGFQDALQFPTVTGDAGVGWLEDTGRGIRLRTAARGIAPPDDAAVPRVTVRRLGPAVVKWSSDLRLRVTCSAACDVTALSPSAGVGGRLALDKAGHGTLVISPFQEGAVAPLHGRARVRLVYGPPGTLHPRVRTVSVKLRVRSTPRLPHVIALKAVRRGDDVRVTFRLRRATGWVSFYATGAAERGGTPVTVAIPAGTVTDRHTRFRITLHHAQGVRFVTLGVLPWSRRYATTREIRVG